MGRRQAAPGERIRALRVRRGLSQRDLAERAKVTQPYICQLETQRHVSPSLPVLQRLARALGVRVAALFE